MEDNPSLNETIKPEIIIAAATVEEEISRVSQYLTSSNPRNREEMNITMPSGPNVLHKVKEEYNQAFCLAGLEKVRAAIPTIQSAVETLGQFQRDWGFKIEDRYKIVLTRYGTGGSYDTKAKKVIVRTTEQSEFERLKPATTPIHEITHLCVEQLVKQFRLSFTEKERLVNGMDVLLFPEIFDADNQVPETERQAKLDMLSILPELIKQMKLKDVS